MMTTIFNPIGLLAPLPAANALEMLGELAGARLLPPAAAEPTILSTAPSAEAAVAGAGRFAPSAADFCDGLRRPTALEKLRSRFDPDKKYSDDEKLEMAKLLPDVVEEITTATHERIQNVVNGSENSEGLASWFEEQRSWFSRMTESLRDRDAAESHWPIINDIISSVLQTVGIYAADVVVIRNSPQKAAGILRELEEMRFKIVLLSENKGYQISHIKRELAGIFIFSLIREASVSWQGHQLVVVRPLTPSPFTVGAAVHSSLKSAAWPLDFDDLGVRVRLQLLGWRITQEVAGDTVTLRIDFGASLYPKPDLMEEWYQNLPADLRKSVDTQLSDTGNRKMDILAALGKVYKNRITAVNDQPPDASNWDYFLEDIQMLRNCLAKMEELQTSLQSGVAAGAFTMEAFWEALNHGDGRTSYENWMARVERAKGAYEEGVQAARRELWARFDSLQGQMEAMKKELARKIRGKEEASSIAIWIAEEVRRLTPLAETLRTLNKKLFEGGIVEEPARYAVSSYLHDKVFRDLHTFLNDADLIRRGDSHRLPKLLQFLSPLPQAIGPLLERLVDVFYSRAAARGVVVGGGCVEPSEGAVIQLAESVDLELVEGILSNLIENGIKYSDSKKARRSVVLLYDGFENVLEYKDNGIGMEPEFAASLGSEAGLRELDRVGDVVGTGTGWPIIVHHLRELRWDWEIKTAPGEGLVVRIQIPKEHLLMGAE